MSIQFNAPQTPAEFARDELIGSLIGLARTTYSEPKSEDTDRILRAGLALAANADAQTAALERMLAIVRAEKLRIAPNCASCTMRCGNTDNYDMARLWQAPQKTLTLKLRILQYLFEMAQMDTNETIAETICKCLFVLAEDWDEELLRPAMLQAREVIRGQTPKQ